MLAEDVGVRKKTHNRGNSGGHSDISQILSREITSRAIQAYGSLT